MNQISLAPIGILRSPFKEKFGIPRQGNLAASIEAEIELFPKDRGEAWLDGIEGFSHLWLISVFHSHLGFKGPSKIHPPRLDGESVGILASRSPHRPNPIGLTLVNFVSRSGHRLKVHGVDLLDETPILDIKPFIADCDTAIHARQGWVGSNPWPKKSVIIANSISGDLERLYELVPQPVRPEKLLAMVEEILREDPRSVVDRQSDRLFWLRLYDIDFGFRIVENNVLVERVRFAYSSPLFAKFEQENQKSQN